MLRRFASTRATQKDANYVLYALAGVYSDQLSLAGL
jgi:hypothetical protein